MVTHSLSLVVAFLLCLGFASAVKEAVKPLELPAVQTSVTSTQFNPAETNAGGTTNSAGTFNVVSLSQSLSFVYNSNLPQTTSFVITSPNIAKPADVSTPAYLTAKTASTVAATTTSSSSISLSPGISVIAAPSATGKSDSAMSLAPIQLSWTLLLSGAAAVVGAALVL